MHHELKILPQYFCRVKGGTKTFEIRKNDRGYQPGDTVSMREYDPQRHEEEYHCFSGKMVGPFTVGYVLPIDAERVVFSLLPLSQKLAQEES